MNKNL
jgi:hypothetical protein